MPTHTASGNTESAQGSEFRNSVAALPIEFGPTGGGLHEAEEHVEIESVKTAAEIHLKS